MVNNASSVSYRDYASALSHCGGGYDDADIAAVVAYRTAQTSPDPRQLLPEQALNSILAVSIAAAETEHRPLTVLDFGGACGIHYVINARTIGLPLRWAVVETPTMAERAMKVAQGQFEVFTNINAAAKTLGVIDLVHTSGAIQYTPDPLAALKTLAALNARHFALLRFPVWRGPQCVTIQEFPLAEHGMGPMPPHIVDRPVRCPITYSDIDEVVRVLGNYQIRLTLGSPSTGAQFQNKPVPGVNILFTAIAGQAAHNK
jgi:putative methyltransferase (TIGR04325 family)